MREKNRDTYAGSHIKRPDRKKFSEIPKPSLPFSLFDTHTHTQREKGPGLAEALTSVFTVEGQYLVQSGTQNSCQINRLSEEVGGEEHCRKCTKRVNATNDLEVYLHWSH